MEPSRIKSAEDAFSAENGFAGLAERDGRYASHCDAASQKQTGTAALWLYSAVMWFCLTLFGCGSDEAGDRRLVPTNEVTTKVTDGSVALTVAFGPHPARLSDQPRLRITVEHDLKVEVSPASLPEGLEDFSVLDSRQELPTTQGNRVQWQRIYVLEPLRTGACQIPPVRVSYSGPSEELGEGRELVTEPLAVEVVSTVDPKKLGWNELRGPEDPVPLEAESHWWLWATVALIVPLIAAGFWLMRRTTRPPAEPSARHVALRELEALWFSKVATSDIKQFYLQLTLIVRRYIEATTGLHAPEQTTDEFLSVAATAASFSSDERTRLGDFLQAADLVKFAGLEPQESDTLAAFQTARRFIQSHEEVGEESAETN